MTWHVLDLFAGIGGFSLGLERAGMTTVAFCECDPFCRHVLAKHWPGVPCYDDVRTLNAARLAADGVGAIDVICGGFPCVDLSYAGKGAGIVGEHSGLWREFARLIRELRPRHVLVENVTALLARGMGDVLGDLAALGFDAEWHCIPAAAVGAPHRRDRVWIMADADGGRCEVERLTQHADQLGKSWCEFDGRSARRRGTRATRGHALAAALARHVAHADRERGCSGRDERSHAVDAYDTSQARGGRDAWWSVEPAMGRLAHGISDGLARPALHALGNSLVPQVAETLGRTLTEET